MGGVIGTAFVHYVNENRFYFKHQIFMYTGKCTRNLMVKVMKVTEKLLGR